MKSEEKHGISMKGFVCGTKKLGPCPGSDEKAPKNPKRRGGMATSAH